MRILVVSWDNIGDVIMASTIASVLKQDLSAARIVFWTKAYSAPILEACPDVDESIGTNPYWEGSRLHSQGAFREFVDVVRGLRADRPDIAFVLNTEWRRSICCLLAGVPLRVGYARRKSRLLLTQAVPTLSGGHILDTHEHLLSEFLGRPVGTLTPRLFLSERQEEFARRFLQDEGIEPGSETLAVHGFAGADRKCWPRDRLLTLCERFLTERPRSRVLGLCGPWERPELEGWRARLGPRFSMPPPQSSVADTLAVLRQCSFFVGMDSGWAHASAAIGVPTVVLFGPSRPEQSAPRGAGIVRVVHRDPLDEISVETVWNGLEEIREDAGARVRTDPDRERR